MEKNAKFQVAGVGIDLRGDWPDAAFDRAGAYEVNELPADNVLTLTFHREERIPAAKLDEFFGVRHFIEEYGRCAESFVTQDRDGDDSLATVVYSSDFRSADCRLVDVEPFGGAALETRMFVAAGRCLLTALPSFGGLTFHSSAISFNGQALLFAAPSGTGKSTQTGLWRKFYPKETAYINDDTPILMKKDGVIRAFGSPWAGTSGINGNISAPVRAIIYVERGTDNSVRPLEGTEKMLRLLRSVREQIFPEQARLQNELIFALTEVPAYELRCDISRGAVETVKSLLFGQK